MPPYIEVEGRKIGPGRPTYVIAEMSANHGNDFDLARRTVEAAKRSGADAIKLQTYTPDTLTIAADSDHFRISGGTNWDGRTLYDLYAEACMPWEWQPELRDLAVDLGLHFFSTAYDLTALEFLEDLGIAVHKVASFEIVDIPLIKAMAATSKPLIISTGMANLSEIEDAVDAARSRGDGGVALLKCTSAYPAPPESMNLRTIPNLAETFGVVAGLSDHTTGATAAITAVGLGASIVEKHFTLSRERPGPDSAFSMEPDEFADMVDAIRVCESAMGDVAYGTGRAESSSLVFRRSLFVVRPVGKGEPLTAANIRSIRPGYGLPPKYYEQVLDGKTAAVDIEAGTPLSWDLITSRRS